MIRIIVLKSCDVGIHWKESRMYDSQGIHGFDFACGSELHWEKHQAVFLLFCVVLSFSLLSA